MNVVQEEIATPEVCNRTLVYNAVIAAIITAGVALTVFVYTFSCLAAIFMPVPALAGLGIVVWRLIKAKEYSSFPVIIFYVVLTFILAALTVAAPSNYTVMLCFAVLILVSSCAIFLMKKNRTITAATVFCIIMCFCSVLCFYIFKTTFAFRRGDISGFYTLKENAEIRLSFWTVVLFSLATVFIAAYLFYLANQKRRITTRYVTYAAMFAALSVLFKLMGNSITGSLAFISKDLKLSLVYIPWVLAGIVLGPAGGIIAAGVGDFIGQMLLPTGGTWFWLTAVSNMLFPVFVVLAFSLPLNKKYNWLKLLIGIILSTMICTLGLGTLSLAIQFPNKPTVWESYWYQLALRWPQPIIIGINYVLILSLLPVLERLKIMRLKFFEPK